MLFRDYCNLISDAISVIAVVSATSPPGSGIEDSDMCPNFVGMGFVGYIIYICGSLCQRIMPYIKKQIRGRSLSERQ